MRYFSNAFQLYALVICAASILLLFLPLLVKAVAHCRRQFASADRAELTLSLIFSVQLTFSWGVITHVAEGLQSPQTGGKILVALVALLLLLLQLALALRFARNVFSFKRGLDSGVWRSPGWFSWCRCCGQICCATDRPIYPRRLEKQVAYLTGRFASHAPRWQLIIWLRQLLLVLLAFLSNLLHHDVANGAFDTARYLIALAAIAVTLGFWYAHHRTQPYAFDFQNAIESWLYGSAALLLVLACASTALPDASSATGTVLEVLMLLVLLGSLVASALYATWRVKLVRRVLAEADVSAVLLMEAEKPIDGKLRERLGDGSIRLLRCEWLLSMESDASLGRDAATGNAVMRRQQELPPEAFYSAEDAADLLKRGDRSIFALSYGWLTRAHPDPHGTTLSAVRRYLQSESSAVVRCALFWE